MTGVAGSSETEVVEAIEGSEAEKVKVVQSWEVELLWRDVPAEFSTAPVVAA